MLASTKWPPRLFWKERVEHAEGQVAELVVSHGDPESCPLGSLHVRGSVLLDNGPINRMVHMHVSGAVPAVA
jgi:hypothetical protein